MAKFIENISNGNFEIVSEIGNDRFANQVFVALKSTDYQLAVEFMEQYRHYKYTGSLLER